MKYYIKDKQIIKIEESYDEVIEWDFWYNVYFEDWKIQQIHTQTKEAYEENMKSVYIAKAIMYKSVWEIPENVLTKLDIDYLNLRISELSSIKKSTDAEKQELKQLQSLVDSFTK